MSFTCWFQPVSHRYFSLLWVYIKSVKGVVASIAIAQIVHNRFWWFFTFRRSRRGGLRWCGFFSEKDVILQRIFNPNIPLLLKKTTIKTMGLFHTEPSVETLLVMKPVWKWYSYLRTRLISTNWNSVSRDIPYVIHLLISTGLTQIFFAVVSVH